MTLDPKILLSRLRLKRDYKETFETEHGRRVLAHILKVSGATHPKFTTDPQQLLWNEAQRHLALSIFKQVHSSEDRLINQLEESTNHTE